MPKRIGIQEPVPQPVEEKVDGNKLVPEVNVQTAFKKGDKVIIDHVPHGVVIGWNASWNKSMTASVGSKGVIEEVMMRNSTGYQVRLNSNSNRWSYPSSSLRLDKPKKRVRVGPGPWDAAPCTHLRWHLMGFFREKLALVKTTAKGADGQDVEVTEMDVKCTKCDTTMKLQAK